MDGGTGQTSSGWNPFPFMLANDDSRRSSPGEDPSRIRRREGQRSVDSAPAALLLDVNAARVSTKDEPGIARSKSHGFGSSVDDYHESQSQGGASTQPGDPSPSISMKRTFSETLELQDQGTETAEVASLEGDDLTQQLKAAVPDTDDVALSVDTPRMWTLALLSAVVGSSMNLLFSLRYPSVTLTPIVALLVIHPIGCFWDRVLKLPSDDEYRMSQDQAAIDPPNGGGALSDYGCSAFFARGARRWRLRSWLSQGRWNRKEHACVFVSSNVSFTFAFATDVIAEQVKFYKQDASILYQILLILSTQLIGYSIAGAFSDFLVRPKEMIWPSNLVATSMLSTLHNEKKVSAGRWPMTRWRFFTIIFGASLAWYFLPGLIMPTLSYFNALTWIAPSSVVIANLFGVSSGLGMLPVTFDWSQIAYTGSPLIVPFWAAMNVLVGLVVVMWLIAPMLYYSNTFFSSFLPILSASVYDNKARLYDISKIMTPDFTFDAPAYHAYSPVFLPMTYALSYAIQFASTTALITHTLLYHGTTILGQCKESFSRSQYQRQQRRLSKDQAQSSSLAPNAPLLGHEADPALDIDIYPQVPFFWYLGTGLVTAFIAMFVVEYYPIHLPWWSILVALAVCLVLILPIGIVMAMTNLQISIYLVSQILAGLMFPGRGVANIVFVTYTYITSTQALKFASDLKLGTYMSIPPRVLFKVQVAATVVSSLSQIGVLNWAFHNIPNICTPTATNGFTCPIARVHFNGSVLWGLIGPSRFFGPNALYRPLIYAFPFGAICPLIPWLLSLRPNASPPWRKINFPVIFGSLSWIPPATGLNFSVWALVCFIFNFVVRRRQGEWWRKYNTILSAGLDAGTAVGVLVVFFGVKYWGFDGGLKWWGTEVYKLGCDWKGCAYRQVGEGETFGPGRW